MLTLSYAVLYIIITLFFIVFCTIAYFVMTRGHEVCRMCNRVVSFENVAPSAMVKDEYICNECKYKEE